MSDAQQSFPDLPNPYAPPTASSLEPDAVPRVEVELEPVGFWRRAAARIIDLAFHMMVGLFMGLVVGIVAAVVSGVQGVPFEILYARIEPATWVGWVTGVLGSMVYQVIVEGWHGCSAGKILLGIVVLREDARPCTPYQALVREALYFVDSLLFGAIAASQMSQSPLKQRLGDQKANTVVVYRRSAPPQSLRSGLRFVAVNLLAALADAAVLALPYFFRLSNL